MAGRDKGIFDNKWKKKLEASRSKPKTTGYLLQIFVPVVLAVAVLSGAVVGVFFSWVFALQCVACVLVAACPCTLGLIAPLLISVGKEKAKKAGLLVNIPEALDVLGAVDTVVLDLNGTCTEGDTRVMRWVTFDEAQLASDKLLAVMSYLEQGNDHRVAEAIQAAARDKNIEPLSGGHSLGLFKQGVKAVHEGQDYVLGNRATMRDAGITDEVMDALNIPKLHVGQSMLYLASGQAIQGYVVLQDTLRPGTQAFIDYLKSQGIDTHLLTGDAKNTADLYGPEFGINKVNIHAECTPKDKQNLLLNMKKEGKCVAMVGDGINDTEAFLASDVAIVVNHAKEQGVAQQNADIELASQSLLPLIKLIQVAKSTLSNINQNVGFSFIYNALAVFAPMGLLFGAGVMMNPAVGAALMMLQTVLIFANVVRFSAEDEPVVTPQPDLLSGHGNADIPGVSNSVELTHANRKRLNPEGGLDGADDALGDGFNEFKRVRFN